MKKPLEADLEAALVNAARARGGDAPKMRWMSWPGAADRMLLLPGAPGPVLVEIKRPSVGPRLAPRQEAARDMLIACGVRYALLFQFDDVEPLLDRAMAKRWPA